MTAREVMAALLGPGAMGAGGLEGSGNPQIHFVLR